MDESCGNCRFFKRNGALQPNGYCRYNPPTPHFVGVVKNNQTQQTIPNVVTTFPQVPDTEWCGCFAVMSPQKVAVAKIDLERLNIAELEGSA